LTTELAAQFPHAQVVAYSASTGTGLGDLVELWTTAPTSGRTAFAIDYDRYAAAEAELAWTNQVFAVHGAGFSPSAWAATLLGHPGAAIAGEQATIGHIKIRLTTPDGSAAKASLTQAAAPPTFDQHHAGPAEEATVTLNARVQVSPAHLDALIDAAVKTADTLAATTRSHRTGEISQPGSPTRLHRM